MKYQYTILFFFTSLLLACTTTKKEKIVAPNLTNRGGIKLEAQQLDSLLKLIEYRDSPKGIAFRIKDTIKKDDGSSSYLKKSERSTVKIEYLEILSVYFDSTLDATTKEVIGLTGQVHQISKKVVDKYGKTVNSKDKKNWEYYKLIKNRKKKQDYFFSFSFFDYHVLKQITSYVKKNEGYIYLGGTSLGAGYLTEKPTSNPNKVSEKQVFNFKIEPRISIGTEYILEHEKLGIPILAFGLSCPPDWYNSDQRNLTELKSFYNSIKNVD